VCVYLGGFDSLLLLKRHLDGTLRLSEEGGREGG